MRIADILSVQLYNCTEYYEYKRKNYSRIKITTLQSYDRNCFYGWGHHAWISYRTIHPVWKNRMQMFEGSRAWSQILFIRKYSRQKAGTDLCATKISGFSQRVSIQVSGTEEYDRRNKQYKSRNITQARGIEIRTNGYHQRRLRCKGFRYFRNDSKQYASILYGKRICRKMSKGGH